MKQISVVVMCLGMLLFCPLSFADDGAAAVVRLAPSKIACFSFSIWKRWHKGRRVNLASLESKLQALVHQLKSQNSLQRHGLLLAVHTGSRGSSRYNQIKSTRFVGKLTKRLIALGLRQDRILGKGFGESCPLPVVAGQSRRMRKLNSRVDLHLIPLKAFVSLQTPHATNHKPSVVLPRKGGATKKVPLPHAPKRVTKRQPRLIHYSSMVSSYPPLSTSLLLRLVKILQTHAGTYVKVESHCDNQESKKKPMLAKKRALAIFAFFRKKGVRKERIEIIVRGSVYPVVSNRSASGRARNRRVVLRILGTKPETR